MINRRSENWRTVRAGLGAALLALSICLAGCASAGATALGTEPDAPAHDEGVLEPDNRIGGDAHRIALAEGFAYPSSAQSEPRTLADDSPEVPSQSDEAERVFYGRVAQGFEVSSFVEGLDACPDYGEGDWFLSDRAFRRRWDEIHGYPDRPHTGAYPVVYVRFYGRRSPPGRYGHLGQYAHEIEVLELIEVLPDMRCGGATPPPPDSRPDLVVDRLDVVMLGVEGGCSLAPPAVALQFCAANEGPETAGAFAYSSDSSTQRRHLGEIPGGAVRCPRPHPWKFLASPALVALDVDDEVDERMEFNNLQYISLPTLTPPPTCEPPRPTALPDLPDLEATSVRHGWEGFEAHCAPRRGGILVGACVTNRGTVPVGAFRVESDLDDVSWQVSGLDAGETYCTELLPGDARRLVVDPEDHIAEFDENNNVLSSIAPPTHPPLCTPIAGAPSADPPGPSVTPTVIRPTITPTPTAPTSTPTMETYRAWLPWLNQALAP